jgi:hypothetical protein
LLLVVGLGIAYYFLYQYNYNEAKDTTMCLMAPKFMLVVYASSNEESERTNDEIVTFGVDCQEGYEFDASGSTCIDGNFISCYIANRITLICFSFYSYSIILYILIQWWSRTIINPLSESIRTFENKLF